jgi:hypothetical protein
VTTSICPDHTWIGTHWIPSNPIDSWDIAVKKRWPHATRQPVARGCVWWFDGWIVAECRHLPFRKGARYQHEAWVAKPDRS